MSQQQKKTIPPWNRIAVDSWTAAQMMGCGRSTFFKRVRDGIYPPKGPDGNWSVAKLRKVHDAEEAQQLAQPRAA